MNNALLKLDIAAVAALGVKEWWQSSQRSAEVQRAFISFHERIKHEQFGERALLRDRRTSLLARLEEALPPGLKLRAFDHGSYSMQTGVKPLHGEFDIDIGLEFDCGKKQFAGPVEAKLLVRDALVQGSRRVAVRRSCVTVHYAGGPSQSDYHVDLAVYVKGPDGSLLLAKGKEHSAAAKCVWEPSDPEQLSALVRQRFSGAAAAQFRRCVRYIKRWKQVNFTTQVPYSIALTIAAYHWFFPNIGSLLSDEPRDLDALRILLLRMLAEFQNGRLRVLLPIAPHSDLLHRMTDRQMLDFRSKLEDLLNALDGAGEAKDINAVVTTLQDWFGSDFV